jgi:hypothetical protein
MYEIAAGIEHTQHEAKINSSKLKEGVRVARKQIDILLADTKSLTKLDPDDRIKKASQAAWENLQDDHPDYVDQVIKRQRLILERTKSIASLEKPSKLSQNTSSIDFFKKHNSDAHITSKLQIKPIVEVNLQLSKKKVLLESKKQHIQEKLDKKMQQSAEIMDQLHKMRFYKKSIQGWLVIIFLGKLLRAFEQKFKSKLISDPSCQTAEDQSGGQDWTFYDEGVVDKEKT